MKSLCVSLETAKKLKAAGWTKRTAFSRIDDGRAFPSYIGPCKIQGIFAPTAEEVLRELPGMINDGLLIITKTQAGYVLRWAGTNLKAHGETTLKEAASQMWLWLVENAYIKTEVKQ